MKGWIRAGRCGKVQHDPLLCCLLATNIAKPLPECTGMPGIFQTRLRKLHSAMNRAILCGNLLVDSMLGGQYFAVSKATAVGRFTFLQTLLSTNILSNAAE